MDVQLSAQALAVIEAKVASGEFRDAQSAIEQALLVLSDGPSIEDDEVWLREAIAEAEGSGEPVEIDLESLKDHIVNGATLHIP